MSLIDAEQIRRIEAAIARLEERSAAEFVLAVVPKSAGYSGVRAIVAGMWALASAIAFVELFPGVHPVWGVLLEVPVALLAWTLTGWAPVFRRLIPRELADRAVAARAFQLFAQRGVHHTRDETGMLLVLSELEHKVVLLGDRGIDQRLGSAGWQKHVDHVIQRIHEGRAADGVLEVIQELEVLLAEHVPVRPNDVNELPNTVIRSV